MALRAKSIGGEHLLYFSDVMGIPQEEVLEEDDYQNDPPQFPLRSFVPEKVQRDHTAKFSQLFIR